MNLALGSGVEQAFAHDIKVYPTVGHAFMNNMGLPAPFKFGCMLTGMAQLKPAPEDSWQRVFERLGEHLR